MQEIQKHAQKDVIESNLEEDFNDDYWKNYFDEFYDNAITETGEPVENIFSAKQMRFLVETLYNSWTPPLRDDNSDLLRPFFADANIGVYFTVNKPPIVPDVLVSLDVSAPKDMFARNGKCYFAWEMGKSPDVAVEIVSNKTGSELTTKMTDYAVGGIRYYVVYDPNLYLSYDKLRVYELGAANQYIRNEDYKLPNVGLGLALWSGDFENSYQEWLRWTDKNGVLIPTADEQRDVSIRRARQAENKAIEAQEKVIEEQNKVIEAQEKAIEAQNKAIEAERLKDEVENRASRLAEKLRELGIDPNQI